MFSFHLFFSIHLLLVLVFVVGSEDGHEELLAAASAVINPGTCH
jgi:hypothetical protein